MDFDAEENQETQIFFLNFLWDYFWVDFQKDFESQLSENFEKSHFLIL